jgi:ectoine hydroxylase-related dioxygenase (phytanoyl-CoA dioxygenase family)
MRIKIILFKENALMKSFCFPFVRFCLLQYPGEGVPIKWHRDASAASVDMIPAIDVGFYLDEANTKFDNCLYVVPGSHRWNDSFASAMIEYLIDGG